MASSESTETRAVIKFCVNLGMTPTQTMDSIRKANMKDNVSRSLIFKWHKRFRDGRETVQGDKGRGRKPKIGATLVASVEERVTQDKRVTNRELVRDTGVSYGTVWTILKDKLNMSRVCARWVPRLLTSVERERRVEDSRKFLRRCNREGEDFLNRIITTDETWLWMYDPETKEQSSVWRRTNSPPPVKARVNKTGGKYMFMMFADRRGMLLRHVVSHGQTVNSDYDCKVLRRDLVQALKKKRPGQPISHFLLHQDNAPPHVSATTTLELSLLELETVGHPPYSPDLAPMDFTVFPQIKSQLKGTRFTHLHELRYATQNIIQQYNEDWYRNIFD